MKHQNNSLIDQYNDICEIKIGKDTIFVSKKELVENILINIRGKVNIDLIAKELLEKWNVFISKKEIQEIVTTQLKRFDFSINKAKENNMMNSFVDREIVFINNILINSKEGLTTSEISKQIYKLHDIKLSKTIVKNYLWSVFREFIDYDPGTYKYILKNLSIPIDDVKVQAEKNTPRFVSLRVCGTDTKIIYNKELNISLLLRALAILNFKTKQSKKKKDLIKQLNRIIEKIEIENDK